MTINQIQDEIITEFSLLDGDMEMTVFYIMELGQKLPAMPEEDKTEENVVKGCQSKVWLTSKLEDGKVYFAADSNTAITKGLVSLLARIFN
jgi:cysteine desulfuration protein SufE